MNNKKAFTLIELMIAITIIVILTLASYAPYNYYQNKAKLKVATREISQFLYESRNMAVNWAISSSWNISIWVYFDSSVNWKNKIEAFSYPHDIDILNITNQVWWDIKILKTLLLQKGVQVDNVDTMNNFLFFFNSIDWNLTYYSWNWVVRDNISSDKISINLSYMWSTSENMQRTINYFTSTNLIDY